MATTTATSGPIMPFKVWIGETASGTGVASVQLPFDADVCIFNVGANANALTFAVSGTTSGLLKMTGRSATTAAVVTFIAAKVS